MHRHLIPEVRVIVGMILKLLKLFRETAVRVAPDNTTIIKIFA